jgi:hypothetical protein
MMSQLSESPRPRSSGQPGILNSPAAMLLGLPLRQRLPKETYMQSADGHLMPMKKDQPPPDLRYFNQSKK